MVDYTNTTLHFRIIKEIGGEGKNSSVYTAHDIQLDTEIVVKKINKTDFKDSLTFFDEAKRLYSSSHQNVVPIQYSCQDNDHVYISMPHFEKGSLNNLIDQRALSPCEIIKYSIDFLSGLHYIHTKRLLHGDIKPTNILISKSNDAVLADFGLSRFLNDDGTATIDKFYDWHRAPETLQSNVVNHQSDIFQAGLTIYRLCNGNAFWNSQIERFIKNGKLDENKFYSAIYNGKFPDRISYIDHIPQRIRNYIRKALAVDPTERYQSVLDFLNDLAGVEITYNWYYHPTSNGPIWDCVKDDKEYKIELIIKSETCEILTTKKVLGGSERKIKEYTQNKVKHSEAYKIIKEALHKKDL